MSNQIIAWLLEGDVAVQYHVHRYLLESNQTLWQALQDRIPLEGFGQAYLACQTENGYWGKGYYQPKWISTHYTLLDLKLIGCPLTPAIQKALTLSLEAYGHEANTVTTDLCVNGMFLNIASHFGVEEQALISMVDYVLGHQMPDGGFNCQSTRRKVNHSSLHTTLSVCEGLSGFLKAGYTHKQEAIKAALMASHTFLLTHHLYLSSRTGEVIKNTFTMFSFPPRWYFDVMRALEYFADEKLPYDPRLASALGLLKHKSTKKGLWKVQNKHTGLVHFDMEKTGQPSRWNTYRALKILKHYDKKTYEEMLT